MLRIFLLASLLLCAVSLSPTSVRADDEPSGTAAVEKPKGFFETNYVITECVCLAAFTLLHILASLSNTYSQTITTAHSDYWGKPLGWSYTYIPVYKEPSSWAEIRHELMVLGIIYVVVRMTCLAGLFTLIYQFLGVFIDFFCGL